MLAGSSGGEAKRSWAIGDLRAKATVSGVNAALISETQKNVKRLYLVSHYKLWSSTLPIIDTKWT